MLVLAQVALPPTPPADPNLLSGRTIEGLLIALTIVAVTVVPINILRPIIRALARRIESRGGDFALRNGEGS